MRMRTVSRTAERYANPAAANADIDHLANHQEEAGRTPRTSRDTSLSVKASSSCCLALSSCFHFVADTCRSQPRPDKRKTCNDASVSQSHQIIGDIPGDGERRGASQDHPEKPSPIAPETTDVLTAGTSSRRPGAMLPRRRNHSSTPVERRPGRFIPRTPSSSYSPSRTFAAVPQMFTAGTKQSSPRVSSAMGASGSGYSQARNEKCPSMQPSFSNL